VRLFLAALTVGAAGIGYVYIQQSDLNSAAAQSTPGSLFDWQLANDPVAVATDDGPVDSGEAPLAVRDSINKARSEITSKLDEFVRVNVVPDPESNAGSIPQDIISRDGVAQTRHTEIDDSVAAEPAPVIPKRNPIDEDEQDIGSVPASEQSESKPGTAKPSINDATLLTKKPDTANAGSGVSSESQTSSSSPRNTTELLPGKISSKDKKVFDSGWTSIGKTTKDLPMHTRQFGREGIRTLVISGLDGQDLIAVRWNDQLAEVLSRKNDLFPANEVQLFRAGNPDGLVKIASANSRGVLINRNFPSRRYQLLPDKTSGPGPVSEAETKVILDILYTFRPRRVIHLMSTSGPSTVFYNRAAKDIAAELRKDHRLETQPLDVELVPGSLEDFSDGTLDAAVLTLQLTGGSDWQQNWNKHLPAVLTAINGRNLAKMQSVSSDVASSREAVRISDPEAMSVPVQKIRRGYEELPPPPR